MREEEAKAGEGYHWQKAVSKQAATPVELDPCELHVTARNKVDHRPEEH